MVEQILVQRLLDLAHKLRILSIKMTDVTGTGHPTSCSSIAEIMSVLFFHQMKYDPKNPSNPSSDRFVLSKGHAAPILYAAWSEAGFIPEKDLMRLRLIDSDLEGHPTPRLPFVDIATGSLGQGLAVSAGMAYGARFEKSSYRVYCLMGDGECAEGSVWEACALASYYGLDNLIAIVDVNSLGQSGYTMLKDDMVVYKNRFEAFGFKTYIVNGQSVQELLTAFSLAEDNKGSPFVILAKTEKGAHFPGISGQMNWHGKALGSKSAEVISYLQGLIVESSLRGSELISSSQIPTFYLDPIVKCPEVLKELPSYNVGQEVATRVAGGNALVKLGKSCSRMIVCDADVKNSTYTDKFKAAFPNRFIDCFIAEQNLVGVATGLSCRNRLIVFISTFGAFFTRSHDQLRMAAISGSIIKVIGTHCGVSIGEDGSSQMALEDIAMFRSLPNAVVLYPSDAVSAERAVELAAKTEALVYIRMGRPNVPVFYSENEVFKIGCAKICKQSNKDQILIVTSGVTFPEALKASESLKNDSIHVRVMDLFSIKPLDSEALIQNASACNNLVLTVEDHYKEGGLGEAVASCLSESGQKFTVHSIYVNSLPRSGKPRELMDMYNLTAEKIGQKIISLIHQ